MTGRRREVAAHVAGFVDEAYVTAALPLLRIDADYLAQLTRFEVSLDGCVGGAWLLGLTQRACRVATLPPKRLS